VERARAGDRPAFAALYERYASTVHGVLLARVPPEEARDLVQEVFLVALRALDTLADAGRVGAWLCAIARNKVRDHYKGRRPALELGEVSEPADPGAGVASPDEGEEARAVLSLLRELPEAYRETLAMRLVEDLTGPEIALRTGMTQGSVRVNLHRGMKLLRERLERLGWRGALS